MLRLLLVVKLERNVSKACLVILSHCSTSTTQVDETMDNSFLLIWVKGICQFPRTVLGGDY